MELWFIHGWGFDARFWDAVCERLETYKCRRLDQGYYGGARSDIPSAPDCVLIGHSLGLVYGMTQREDWAGWVGINGFPRFVRAQGLLGCAAAAELRELRRNLGRYGGHALQRFYAHIGGVPPAGQPDIDRLRGGLDELRDLHLRHPTAVPALILASENDPLVPRETSAALATMSSNSQLLWHTEGGHCLPQTAPAWCAEAIASFVQQHFGAK
ncbi:MAG: alpha/beta hydrolase [Pseudomonadota bacterium]|nr:alpha/beta hydrolase [Pseudomonadota bacterium]